MVLENQHKEEDYASFHFQNTLVDYHIKILPPPPQNTEIEIGVSFKQNIRYLNLKDIFQGEVDSWIQFYGIPTSSWRWSQTGFVFQLSRRWTRYIFIYYLPSSLCVITSWASFLINPQVNHSNGFCIP